MPDETSDDKIKSMVEEELRQKSIKDYNKNQFLASQYGAWGDSEPPEYACEICGKIEPCKCEEE